MPYPWRPRNNTRSPYLVAPHLATGHAWGHAIIVVVFAVLLPLRMRAAPEGKAQRAHGGRDHQRHDRCREPGGGRARRCLSHLDAGRDALSRRADGGQRAARDPRRARREPSGVTTAAGGCGRLRGVASGPPQAAGRRRRPLGEDERREQIIRGCVDVLAREGIPECLPRTHRPSRRRPKGLISHYFSDKETLMEQTAIATVAYLRTEVASAIDLTVFIGVVMVGLRHPRRDEKGVAPECGWSIAAYFAAGRERSPPSRADARTDRHRPETALCFASPVS
jgi:hypothetical protein